MRSRPGSTRPEHVQARGRGSGDMYASAGDGVGGSEGGIVTATLPVTPGQVLTVSVGGNGAVGSNTEQRTAGRIRRRWRHVLRHGVRRQRRRRLRDSRPKLGPSTRSPGGGAATAHRLAAPVAPIPVPGNAWLPGPAPAACPGQLRRHLCPRRRRRHPDPGRPGRHHRIRSATTPPTAASARAARQGDYLRRAGRAAAAASGYYGGGGGDPSAQEAVAAAPTCAVSPARSAKREGFGNDTTATPEVDLTPDHGDRHDLDRDDLCGHSVAVQQCPAVDHSDQRRS